MKSQRLWVLGIVVLVLAAIINVAALNIAEQGFIDLRETAGWVSHTQRAQNLIEHILRLAVDAETAQRGYLMTGRDTQLERYSKSRSEIPVVLKELRELTQDNPVQAAQLVTVGTELGARMDILQAGIDIKRSGDAAAFDDYMQQRGGKIAMDALRLALDGMATEERGLYERRFRVFERELRLSRWGFYLVVGLNLLLLVLGAIALGQDARRRRQEAVEAKGRNAELERAVLERTTELTELSHFLQRVQEDERARLAREIHDELGGTLAAAKIDLQMLSNKLEPDHPQQVRLARAMTAIDDSIQVKRRIIEDLRPSILDNLGLAAAVRWQCAEFAKRTGVPCRVELLDDGARHVAGVSHCVLPHRPGIIDQHRQARQREERRRLRPARRRPLDPARRRRRHRHRPGQASGSDGARPARDARTRARPRRRIVDPAGSRQRDGRRNARCGRPGAARPARRRVAIPR